MAWQSYYSRPGNAFGIKGPFYGAQGHRGKDYIVQAGTATPAYAAGKVVLIQWSRFLGQCVVVQMHNGKFAGYAHQKRKVNVVLGQIVEAGKTLSWVAGANDDPGSSWAGDHLHTTLSKTKLGIFSGDVLDPGPGITAACRVAKPALATVDAPIKLAPKPTPTERKINMTTGYWTDRQNRTPPTPTDWALSDGGVWLPMGNEVAQKAAALHGGFLFLLPSSFESYKKLHESAPTNGLSAEAVKQIVDAIKALPVGIVTEEARRLKD